MIWNRYRVPPFSGKNYQHNSSKCPKGTESCAICGRPVKTGNAEPALSAHPHWAVVIDGGSSWGDETSDENDGGYMGCWPVGNDCHRRHVAKPEGER